MLVWGKDMEFVKNLRFWLARKLIGNMHVIANVKISDFDVEQNLKRWNDDSEQFMFYNNRVYRLEQHLMETVWSGNTGKVERRGNMFVLTR